MPLSQTAKDDARAKLATLQQAHGSLSELKADEQYRIAYPDAIDLHEWRMEWNRARHAERHPLPEVDGTTLREHPGHGVPMEGIPVPADGSVHELVAEEAPRRRRKGK